MKKIMRKTSKRKVAAILTTALAAGVFSQPVEPVLAATEHWNDASEDATAWNAYKANWETTSQNFEHVSLTPGKNETTLNFAWYSKTAETPQVRFAKSKEALETAQAVTGAQTAITIEALQGYYSNKVSISGLEENTTYYYQVFQDGAWQEPQTFATKSFSKFSFFYVGDPQIGACKSQTSSEDEKMVEAGTSPSDTLAARNDAYNWNKVLKQATAAHPEASFMVSAGDQVNDATNEMEYAGYLGADALTSLPVATTIGNHDSKSENYQLHYNNPNAFTAADTGYVEGQTKAGTDYYYTYGNTLFIMLDTNNYNCATHENVIKKAVAENPDAKWRVVTFHQDIYGSGYDHSDSDGIVLRTQLTPLMDKYNIDVVLQGHDHTYSRSYQLTGDGAQHASYDNTNWQNDTAAFAAQNQCYQINSQTVTGSVENPTGTVYMEANSATGSKFYNLIATQQDYIAERSQTWQPSYSVIDVDDTTFTITTYDAKTNAVMPGSSTYTIEKKEKTEPQKITAKNSYTKTFGSKDFSLNVKADGVLTYKSSDEKVAKVDENGTVHLAGTGKAVIHVKAAETASAKEAETDITIFVSPKKATLTKLTKAKNGLQAEWKADKTATGYEVSYATNAQFKKAVVKNIAKNNTVKVKLTGLKAKKTYYVRVRAYKKVGSTKVYGPYSTVKKATLK
ncbi:MAG: fibronectin type III domain-containing protein [Lachnospiraceae bacterium]